MHTDQEMKDEKLEKTENEESKTDVMEDNATQQKEQDKSSSDEES